MPLLKELLKHTRNIEIRPRNNIMSPEEEILSPSIVLWLDDEWLRNAVKRPTLGAFTGSVKESNGLRQGAGAADANGSAENTQNTHDAEQQALGRATQQLEDELAGLGKVDVEIARTRLVQTDQQTPTGVSCTISDMSFITDAKNPKRDPGKKFDMMQKVIAHVTEEFVGVQKEKAAAEAVIRAQL